MVADLGLDTITFQPFRDFEGMPRAGARKVFARAERKFDVMQELGCDLLMVCSNVSPDAIGGIDRAAADLRELGERAAQRGLRVGFEALAWGRHINDYRDAWEVVRRADHPAVGLVLDTFHILVRGTDLSAIRSIPRRPHLPGADGGRAAARDGLPVLEPALPQFPGPGRACRCGDFMQALQATGYDGLLSLEIFNDQFRAGSARSVAVDGHRSLHLHARTQLRGRTGAPSLGFPRCRRGHVPWRRIRRVRDRRSAARRSRRRCGASASRSAGAHRSKAVTRWQQGDINIVVNSDKEGFAHSFNITHGASVCAIALRVDDAAATVERAVKLLDTPFTPGASGRASSNIPACAGSAAACSISSTARASSGGCGTSTSSATRREAGRTPA